VFGWRIFAYKFATSPNHQTGFWYGAVVLFCGFKKTQILLFEVVIFALLT
jgi:hypothetical protein